MPTKDRLHRLWHARLAVTAAAVLWTSTAVWAQSPGAVRGIVTLVESGGAVHGAVVLIVRPGLVALTDEQGEFVIENVPAGNYEILAQREHLSATRRRQRQRSGRDVCQYAARTG